MSSNIDFDEISNPPRLIHLDIWRDTYCNQIKADSICAYLWDYRPNLIAEMAKYEKNSNIITSHMGDYSKICDTIIEHLKNDAPKELDIPKSNIAFLDLIYEISRRIRHGLKLKAIPPIGTSLSPSRDEFSQYPQVIFNFNDILLDIYKSNYILFFDYAEQTRLLTYISEIEIALKSSIWNLLSDDDKQNPRFMSNLITEINIALDKICGFSQEMKKRGYDVV